MTDQVTDWVTDDDEAVSALVNMVVVLADNKYALGRRLAEWAVGPPTLEGSVAGAAIGQQLLGQARVLYPVLEQLPATDLGVPEDSGRTRFYNMAAADGPWPTWAHAVCSYFLVNSACNVVLAALADSAYSDLAKRVTKMRDDERFQTQYGAGRVRELVARYAAGGRLLQEQVDASFTEVLAWFGPHDEPGVSALARAGLVTGDNEQWRQEWLDAIGPVLEEVGIGFPADRASADPTTGRWEWGDVPWESWTPLQRRLEQTTSRMQSV
ncbi:MAG TPA: Phenylacetic acid catabolic protein [Jiangellaceae bacterium]|nr:Phenylacetic acid catabolic protein [Jiangellaceae bacterium]